MLPALQKPTGRAVGGVSPATPESVGDDAAKTDASPASTSTSSDNIPDSPTLGVRGKANGGGKTGSGDANGLPGLPSHGQAAGASPPFTLPQGSSPIRTSSLKRTPKVGSNVRTLYHDVAGIHPLLRDGNTSGIGSSQRRPEPLIWRAGTRNKEGEGGNVGNAAVKGTGTLSPEEARDALFMSNVFASDTPPESPESPEQSKKADYRDVFRMVRSRSGFGPAMETISEGSNETESHHDDVPPPPIPLRSARNLASITQPRKVAATSEQPSEPRGSRGPSSHEPSHVSQLPPEDCFSFEASFKMIDNYLRVAEAAEHGEGSLSKAPPSPTKRMPRQSSIASIASVLSLSSAKTPSSKSSLGAGERLQQDLNFARGFPSTPILPPIERTDFDSFTLFTNPSLQPPPIDGSVASSKTASCGEPRPPRLPRILDSQFGTGLGLSFGGELSSALPTSTIVKEKTIQELVDEQRIDDDDSGYVTGRSRLERDMGFSKEQSAQCIELIHHWHRKERSFTQIITAFSCDPRTEKSAKFPPSVRQRFSRLLAPFLAFSFEIQYYCVRYIDEYQTKKRPQRPEWKEDRCDTIGSEMIRSFREEFRGLGSSSERICDCHIGCICPKACSSRDGGEPPKPLTPPSSTFSQQLQTRSDGDDNEPALLQLRGKPDDLPKCSRIDLSPTTFWQNEREKWVKGKEVQEIPPWERDQHEESYPRYRKGQSSRGKNEKKEQKETQQNTIHCPRLPAIIDYPSTTSFGSKITSTSKPEAVREAMVKFCRQVWLKPGIPLTGPHEMVFRALSLVIEALDCLEQFMAEMVYRYQVTESPAEYSASARRRAMRRFYCEMLPQAGDRVWGVISILEEQTALIAEVLDRSTPTTVSSMLTAENERWQGRRPSWTRASAAKAFMSGGVPATGIVNVSLRTSRDGTTESSPSDDGAQSATMPLLARSSSAGSDTSSQGRPKRHQLWQQLEVACAKAEFRVLEKLHRFPMLDDATYWGFERLECQLQRLCVHNGQDGAGESCALRYSVIGLVQQILDRHGDRRHRRRDRPISYPATYPFTRLLFRWPRLLRSGRSNAVVSERADDGCKGIPDCKGTPGCKGIPDWVTRVWSYEGKRREKGKIES
ncbi:hypothetical protein B0T26DRAFT_681603 [Lasiosphaeria miniovina]|uniref:Uncharacterized protein n=1 Tax=Lasiosphaeria miniovina TaxID=1954250 RepID=A0AA40DHQ3_9PEZI|nr:uncharacterized protein B0T26DRAFT_681603 [Lasiosphaeria miniovina]KAK0703984.1 hypothetical protein B0T26DRAFT_681603 [Lasiosphaeria miniovina]